MKEKNKKNREPAKIQGNIIAGLTAMFLPAIIYLFTVCPTIHWGDSGEFVSDIYCLGIPHPTGYPLYVLLGKLFTLIPIGSIAFRVNLMSIVFGTLSIFLLYNLARQIFADRVVSVISALVFAFLGVWWFHCISAEVYSLHVFFVLLLSNLVLIYRQTSDIRYIYAFCFCAGLSVTNHMTTVIFAVPFLYVIFISDYKKIFKIKNLLIESLLAVLPLTLYLFLIFRSRQNPACDWGDPENLKSLFDVISGKQYRFLMFIPDFSQFVQRFWNFLKLLSGEFPVFIIISSLAGLGLLAYKNTRMFVFLLLFMMINVLYSLNYAIPDIEAYYIPFYAVLCLGIGSLALYLTEIIFRGYKKENRNILVYVVQTVFAVAAVFMLTKNFTQNNLSQYYLSYDYGVNMMKSVEENGILVTTGDDRQNPAEYLQVACGERSDVTLVSDVLLLLDWYRKNLKERYGFLKVVDLNTAYNRWTEKKKGREDSMEQDVPLYSFLKDNIKERRIYVAGYARSDILDEFNMENNGLIYRYADKEWDSAGDLILPDYRLRGLDRDDLKDRDTENAKKNYSYAYFNYALAYYSKGDFRNAEYYMKKSAGVNKKFGNPHFMLGNMYLTLGKKEDARKQYEICVEKEPGSEIAEKAKSMLNKF